MIVIASMGSITVKIVEFSLLVLSYCISCEIGESRSLFNMPHLNLRLLALVQKLKTTSK